MQSTWPLPGQQDGLKSFSYYGSKDISHLQPFSLPQNYQRTDNESKTHYLSTAVYLKPRPPPAHPSALGLVYLGRKAAAGVDTISGLITAVSAQIHHHSPRMWTYNDSATQWSIIFGTVTELIGDLPTSHGINTYFPQTD